MKLYHLAYTIISELVRNKQFSKTRSQMLSVLSTIPSGNLAIEAAAQGDSACWYNLEEKLVDDEQKVIIINPLGYPFDDRYINGISEVYADYYLKLCIEIIHVLCDLNFQVYCPNLAGEELVSFNETSPLVLLKPFQYLDNYKFRSYAERKQRYDSELLKKLAFTQKGILAKDIVILDGNFFTHITEISSKIEQITTIRVISSALFIPSCLNQDSRKMLAEKIDDLNIEYYIDSRALFLRKMADTLIDASDIDKCVDTLNKYKVEQLSVINLTPDAAANLPGQLQHLSLDMCLNSYDGEESNTFFNLSKFLEDLTYYSPNLKSLAITIDCRDSMLDKMRICSSEIDFPDSLKSLSIAVKASEIHDVNLVLNVTSLNQLETLYLDNISLKVNSHTETKVKEGRLRSIILKNANIYNINNYNFPHLRNFNIATHDDFQVTLTPYLSCLTKSLHLKHLKIKSGYTDDGIITLNFQHFPLRRLNIINRLEKFKFPIIDLPETLQELKLTLDININPHCSLTSLLYLHCAKNSDDDSASNLLNQLFEASPKLEALVLKTTKATNWLNIKKFPEFLKDLSLYSTHYKADLYWLENLSLTKLRSLFLSIVRNTPSASEENTVINNTKVIQRFLSKLEEVSIIKFDTINSFQYILWALTMPNLQVLLNIDYNFGSSFIQSNSQAIKKLESEIEAANILLKLLNKMAMQDSVDHRLSKSNIQLLIKNYDLLIPMLNLNGQLNKRIAINKSLSSSLNLDMQIKPENQELKASQLFTPLNQQHTPFVGTYRLNHYHSISIIDSEVKLNQVVISSNYCMPVTNTITWDCWQRSTEFFSTNDYGCFYTQRLSKYDWVLLPSFARQQLLTHLFVDDLEPADVDVTWISAISSYAIKLNSNSIKKENRKYNIYFVLNDVLPALNIFSSPPHELSSFDPNFYREYEAIQRLAAEISSFQAPEDEVNQQNIMSGQEKLDYLYRHKVGACRHRSYVFMNQFLKCNFPLEKWRCHVISNAVHMFVEVTYLPQDISWKVDLGGYDMQIAVEQPEQAYSDLHKLKDKLEKVEEQIKEQVSREKVKSHSVSQHPVLANIKSQQNKKFETVDLFAALDKAKSCLISASSEHDVQYLAFYLQKELKNQCDAILYVNDPKQFLCQRRELDYETGLLMPGPAGECYQFLQKPGKKIILINFNLFDHKAIVQCNSLFDTFNRKIDNISLDSTTYIVGIQNKSDPNAYRGADFISRFDEMFDYLPNIATKEIEETEETEETEDIEIADSQQQIAINLYHSANWQSIFGRYFQDEAGFFRIKPNVLLNHIDQACQLTLHNPPANLPDFERFLTAVKLDLPVYFSGVWHDTKLWSISCKEGYDYQQIPNESQWPIYLISDISILPKEPILLINFSHFPQLFESLNYDEATERLIKTDGLLDQLKGQAVNFFIAENLSDDQAAQLVEGIIKADIQPKFFCMENTSLSSILLACSKIIEDECAIDHSHVATNIRLIYSPNPSVSLKKLLTNIEEGLNSSHVMSVAESTLPDVTYLLNPIIQEQKIIFECSISQIAQKLFSGEKVLLVGPIPKIIFNFFKTLFLPMPYILWYGKFREITGQLILLTDQKDYLDGLYYQDDTNTIAAEALPAPLRFEEATYVNTNDFSIEAYEEYCITRKELFARALASSPCVVLAGNTGTGKSTFINQCAKGNEYEVFFGIDKLLDWINYRDNKIAILFIDEANTHGKNWSQFQDLFNEPRGIWHKGYYFPLSEHHKVVMAGNLNYKGERNLPTLFTHQDCAHITFTIIPHIALYYQIIKPAMQSIEEPLDIRNKISMIFLNLYDNVNQYSTADYTAITPRDLICVLAIWKKLNTMPEFDNFGILQKAELIANVFEHWLSPVKKNIDQTKLDDLWNAYQPPNLPEFCVVEEHKESLLALQWFLDIRKFSHAGIRQLILEGPSGVGKTHMIKSFLARLGYEEYVMTDDEAMMDSANLDLGFYHLPANTSYENKKKLLERAHKQGAVVIFDECNSSLLPENYVNNLLMDGTADKPGFFIIGTQNPGYYAGREMTTQAQARRTIKIKSKDLSFESMVKIINYKFSNLSLNISPDIIAYWANQYVCFCQGDLNKEIITLREFLKRLPDFIKLEIPSDQCEQLQPKVEEITDEEMLVDQSSKQTTSVEHQSPTCTSVTFFSGEPPKKRQRTDGGIGMNNEGTSHQSHSSQISVFDRQEISSSSIVDVDLDSVEFHDQVAGLFSCPTPSQSGYPVNMMFSGMGLFSADDFCGLGKRGSLY